jgi:transposase-like protein
MDFMDRTYGVKYSTSQISLITDHLLDDIRAWQNRPLDDQYAVIWIDAIHYKMRHEGKVASRACMLALGINMEGQQDLLSITIVNNESASEWMSILDSLKSRGVEDVLFICSDNLKGMDKAIEAIFPKTIRQICIVHQIRNSLKFVNYADRKKVAADIKQIYRALNEDEALTALENFKQKWGSKYKPAIKSWEDNWHNLAAFLAFPSEIRRLIYTTNIIESFNAGLRKYTKNKKSFPTDDAALKSIYLAAMAVQNKWQKKRHNWSVIYNQLYINFENRIKPAN